MLIASAVLALFVNPSAAQEIRSVEVRPGYRVELSPPLRVSGPGSVSKQAIAGRFDWGLFIRDSIVAPVWIDLDYLKDEAGNRIGHSLHFRFVVHVGFEMLRDKDLMRSWFGDGDGDGDGDSDGGGDDERRLGAFREVDREEVAKLVQARQLEKFGFVEVPLLNRVMLRGLIAAGSVEHGKGVVMDWRLITGDGLPEEYAATWSSLKRDRVGQRVEGDKQPYQGAAGYLSVQSLQPLDARLAGACLIEGRVILNEPEGWFGGSNFLRAKFPLLIQEAVRNFRRRVNSPKATHRPN